MYIGIHINNGFIAAATVDQNHKTILIKDDSIETGNPFMNPLILYLEEEFAYLGDKVAYLLANNYDLEYTAHFLDALETPETPIYKDPGGVKWNVAALLAVFLKKIKADLQIYEDSPLKGAVVNLSLPYTPTIKNSLKMAFAIANIPLYAIVSLEEAALKGYTITPSDSSEQIITCYLDAHNLTLSLTAPGEESEMDKSPVWCQKSMGEQALREKLYVFLVNRYEQTTQRKIKETKKNIPLIKQLVTELIERYVNEHKLYIQLLCKIEDDVIELIVPRLQIQNMVEEYLTESVTFLKTELLNNNINPEAPTIFLLTGDSKLLPLIEQRIKEIFNASTLRLYNQTPEEILTRGAALCASALAENSMGPPLYPELIDTGKAINDENTPSASVSKDEWSRVISAIHINAGCETL